MAISVLIKRKFVSGNEQEIAKLYLEMRMVALKQEGYIGAETLKRMDQPGEYLIISKWKHLDDWSRWLVSKDRRAFQERIDSLTSADTKFEIYTH